MSLPPSHPKLHELPHRLVQVPGSEREWVVPRHIVRIDIAKEGRSETHGWQLRLARPWTLFSDGRYGSTQQALEAAVAHLAEHWSGPRPRALPAERRTKGLLTGMTGVRVVWRRRKNDRYEQCYVRADRLDGTPLVSLYVGTSRTVTDERLQAKLEEALAIRKLYLSKQGRAAS